MNVPFPMKEKKKKGVVNKNWWSRHINNYPSISRNIGSRSYHYGQTHLVSSTISVDDVKLKFLN